MMFRADMSNSLVLAGPSIGISVAGTTADNVPALDRAGIIAFSSQALEQFNRYLKTSKNRTISSIDAVLLSAICVFSKLLCYYD